MTTITHGAACIIITLREHWSQHLRGGGGRMALFSCGDTYKIERGHHPWLRGMGVPPCFGSRGMYGRWFMLRNTFCFGGRTSPRIMVGKEEEGHIHRRIVADHFNCQKVEGDNVSSLTSIPLPSTLPSRFTIGGSMRQWSHGSPMLSTNSSSFVGACGLYSDEEQILHGHGSPFCIHHLLPQYLWCRLCICCTPELGC